MDRILIFILIAALLYALYRYQQNFMDENINKEHFEQKNKKRLEIKHDKLKKGKKRDDISEFSLSGTENIYKQDSVIDSIESKSYNTLDLNSEDKTEISKESFII